MSKGDQEGASSRGRSKKRLGVWAKLKPDTPVVSSVEGQLTLSAEEYRKIAVQIEQSFLSGSDGKILAVTGPEPQCGKTLLSLNMSLILARRGERRVVLVEADLFRPSLRQYLEIEDGIEGMGDILKRSTPVDEALVSVWGSGFDVIFSGQTGDLSDLMTGANLARLGSELRSNYELIIVDCPPLALAAGRTLAGWADKSVVVARAGQTRKGAVEDALRILGPDRTLGLVLNDVKKSPHRVYNYGEGYYQ
jgi:Mrp family chromosome partitioning ATPase